MATKRKKAGKPVKKEKTILVYGLEGLSLLALVSAAEEAGMVCRPVPDSQVGCTVGELLSGKKPAPHPGHLTGRFALLDGFGGREEEATELINSVTPGVVKAVHTRFNDGWAFSRLCAALWQEHCQMNGLS